MSLQDLLVVAAEQKASDLHLVVGLPPALRINGELAFIDGAKALTAKEIQGMLDEVLNENQKERFASTKELDFGLAIDSFRYRVNIHYERTNIGLVARVITDNIPSLEDIGMPKIIYNLLGLKQGLILITGPTGCGKSTTMAAMIEYINANRFCNIITLEDPIEYMFRANKSIIIQRQLGSDMLSFASGLKHCLRQDPNVIMVGEMRDLETIATTITLAETGHLVMATLHTYNAAQTIDRIIDIFPPHQQGQVRTQLSMTLAAVISQRLLHKIDGGRIAAREIMINTPAVANIIRENKIAQLRTVIETCSKEGMTSMDQSLKKMYDDKVITKEEAQSHMSNPELLEKFRFK